MSRTKSKPAAQRAQTSSRNGPACAAGVLTLAEAAAYLRLPEEEVLRMVREQGLPGRQVGDHWRFWEGGIQAWLMSGPAAKDRLLALLDSPDYDPAKGEWEELRQVMARYRAELARDDSR